MKILMVCLGNICRSPLAMIILRDKATINNLDIVVDSAGFEPYHNNDIADPRSAEIAKKHGHDLSFHRARLFRHDDFNVYDKIYVMDDYNYQDVKYTSKNDNEFAKVDLIMNVVYPNQNINVPDPYYGGTNGFENVYKMLDIATDKIIEEIKNTKKQA